MLIILHFFKLKRLRKQRQVPKYVYFCKVCEGVFETSHSLSKTWTICKLCEVEDSLERRPSAIFISKKINKIEGKSSIGNAVKAAIEESKVELQLEKERLKKREHKDE